MKIRVGCVGHTDWKQLPKFRRILLEMTYGGITTYDAQFWRHAERGNFTFLIARRLPLFHQTGRGAVSPLFATVRLALFSSASAWEGLHMPGHCVGAARKPLHCDIHRPHCAVANCRGTLRKLASACNTFKWCYLAQRLERLPGSRGGHARCLCKQQHIVLEYTRARCNPITQSRKHVSLLFVLHFYGG